MEESKREHLGICQDMSVTSESDGQSVVIGGVCRRRADDESTQWKRVLTRRAAQLLWFRLIRYLFPEKAPRVTTLVSTAPLSAISLSPTATTHVEVERKDTDAYEVRGLVGQHKWVIQLDSLEARRLWTALDLALYPDGWEDQPAQTPVSPVVRPKRQRQTYQ